MTIFETPELRNFTFSSARHKTCYLEAGPVDGPLMFFVHGWPEVGLMWRSQMQFFAAQGWRCIAPDMRGYGGSSIPKKNEDFAVSELVLDMVELHDHLGAFPAIWVGHDWGSPVVAALSAHHASRSCGVVLISVPYFPEGFVFSNVISLVDRQLYPVDKYPNGQWDYFRFYTSNFDQTVKDFDADVAATLACIYRRGNAASINQISHTALVAKNGGFFGSAHRAPAIPPDPELWPKADFDLLVKAFEANGFRSANAWYLNDGSNAAYAKLAPAGGRLEQPVLFINGDFDSICTIVGNQLGEPMRRACQDLSVVRLEAGHWLPLESKEEVIRAIQSWLESKNLGTGTGQKACGDT